VPPAGDVGGPSTGTGRRVAKVEVGDMIS
jgi:hypothetical protein